MLLKKEDLLKEALTQTEIFKSSLGDIKLRQLTLIESEEIVTIQKDETKDLKDIMFYTLSKAMVEPTFFTEEEIAQLGRRGQDFIFEVFNEVPLIGMSEEQREEHAKRVEEFLKANKEKEETKKEKAKK